MTCGILALVVSASAASAHLAAAQADVVGHVYVNDNTSAAGGNTVAGYDRHADGTLSAMAGSPFAVGGMGTGAGLAAQGALQLSGDGRYLLAVDAGSNQISVLRIRPDGTLRPAEGSPVASGGDLPVSIAVHGSLVYVANAGAGGSNYTGFTLNPGGHLRPVAGSTVAVPAGVADVLISADGTHLVGTRVGTEMGPTPPTPIDGTIDSFALGADGHLTAAPGSPFPAQANGPFGSAFNPTNSGQFFVSNAHAGAGNGSVSAFAVAADGTLSSIGASPYPNSQTAPCWLEVARDGRHLYTSNTANNSLSEYAVNPDGSLTWELNTPLSGTSPTVTNTRPIDLRLSPDGRDLYVIKAGINTVGELAVNADGSLKEPSAAPVALPAGVMGFASGIVVD
jgi:6-phosphogluconolactonase (cycloisomerase 2 family)